MSDYANHPDGAGDGAGSTDRAPASDSRVMPTGQEGNVPLPRRQAATVNSSFGDSYSGHLPPTPPPIDVSKLNPADMVSSRSESGVILVAVVTDPDGKETTQVFHQTELTVGRDVDNDLCLPDDSVSRCHAMLTLNELGDCMVIDLGSTNGTQVNRETIGREPTAITEDDFVAIGAYAVRVRTLGGEDATRTATIEDESTVAGPTSPHHPVALHHAARMALAAQRDSGGSYPPGAGSAMQPPGAQVATPPPMPSQAPMASQPPASTQGPPIAPPVHGPMPQEPAPVAPMVQGANPSAVHPPARGVSPASTSQPAVSSVPVRSSLPKRTAPIEDVAYDDEPPTGLATHDLSAMQDLIEAHDQRRAQALRDIVQAVIDEVGDGGQNERGESLQRQAARIAGRLEGGRDIVEAVIEQARSELIGWGPLGSWLEGGEVQMVRVRHRRVWVDDGSGWRDTETQFSCDDVVARIAERLREEELSDGEIMRGWRLHVLDDRMNPRGYVVELQRVHLPQSLDTWVKTGGMSAEMRSLLESAVKASENILLVGDGFDFAGALAEVAEADERVWIGPQAADDLSATVLRPRPDARADAIAVLAEMSYRHVFVPDGGIDVWPALVDAVCMGMQGVVTSWPAKTTEVALSRAISCLAAARGCGLEVARGLVLSSFAYAVEVENRPQSRVRRIARLEADGTVTDLFRHRDGQFQSVN